MDHATRTTVATLQDAIKLCLARYPLMTLAQLDLLLTIALKPGCSQSEIADSVNQSLSSVSRALRVLSKGRKETVNKTALGFIRQERNLDDERIVQAYLTEDGERFIKVLSDLLK